MRETPASRPVLLALGLGLAALLALAACADTTQPPAGQTPGRGAPTPEIKTIPEGAEFLTEISGARDIAWTRPPGTSGSCREDSDAVDEIRAAVRDAGDRLAQVDYAVLALPRFITVTRQVTLEPGTWDTGQLELEACGSEGGADRWIVYGIPGEEYPQLPDLPLVHRRPYVYALYDLQARAVSTFFASIRGYVLE